MTDHVTTDAVAPAEAEPSLWSLWAKSDAGGRPHSLPGHLLDTAAVGELIWDTFIAPGVRARLDVACAGSGKDIFVLMCAWHDLGKATPGFQAQVPALAAVATAAGWPIPFGVRRVRHAASSEVIATSVLTARCGGHLRWMAAILEGHHGTFHAATSSHGDHQEHGPTPPWPDGQRSLAEMLIRETGVVLPKAAVAPSLGPQLALAGYLSMADWIASSTLFPGLGALPYDMTRARRRARTAWQRLQLVGGWQPERLGVGTFAQRFGFEPRPLQALVADEAGVMVEPGLMIVEAPMGEGKTEAAFAAIEALSARFGLSGFVFAMPTQGTTDAMFDRCLAWAQQVDPLLPVALLHGKKDANPLWRSVIGELDVEGVFDDPDDPYGMSSSATSESRGAAPTEWLLGRHRGLLCAGVVGTVDQVLMAAKVSKYVALRHAGLAGKVVVIDEVHSYDVFMERYLHQVLRWCSDAGTPVVLMSATLAPQQRSDLITAYVRGLAGGASATDRATARTEQADAIYPRVTIVERDRPVRSLGCATSRPSRRVGISWADGDPGDVESVVRAASQATTHGGIALVIVNTVRRAQATYQSLRSEGVATEILHGRLTTAERARRTAELVDRLGPHRTRTSGRPERLVVVATQIAEQSFDVDADVLVTDIAPIDLVLQRIGRLHRHDRPIQDRPPGLREPRVIVTGVQWTTDGEGPPGTSAAFDYVYGRYALLRSLQVLQGLAAVMVPDDVPSLVSAGYPADGQADWPPGWHETGVRAWQEFEDAKVARGARAGQTVLTPPPRGFGPISLNHLHKPVDGPAMTRGVRDMEPTREVVLIQRDDGGYRTLSGRPLGANAERVSDEQVALDLRGDTVRLREDEVIGHIGALPGWSESALLRYQEALVLDEERRSSGPWGSARYDDDVGLVIERAHR